MMVPSEQRYCELLAALRQTTKAVLEAKDDKARLDAGRAALRAVILYLVADEEVCGGTLTYPLGIVENALHDAGRGATVALLDHTPEQPGKSRGTSQEDVQGSLAFALELLTSGGMGTARAAAWVAGEASKVRLRSADGTPIKPAQITEWRKKIHRRTGPTAAQKVYWSQRDYDPALLAQPRSEIKFAGCQRAAKVLIRSLAAIYPQAAPKQTRRSKNKEV
jgi:hypothetical protein